MSKANGSAISSSSAGSSDLAARITDELRQHRVDGWLRFYGVWFGRPYDSTFRLSAAAARGQDLVLDFAESATVHLERPRSTAVSHSEARGEYAALVIRGAARVRLERPGAGTSGVVEEYSRRGANVVIKRNDGEETVVSVLDKDAPSFEVVSWRS